LARPSITLDVTELAHRYNLGETTMSIARSYGVSNWVVWARLKDSGMIKFRHGLGHVGCKAFAGKHHTQVVKDKLRLIHMGSLNSMWKDSKIKFNCACCGKETERYRCGRQEIKYCSNKCAHEDMPNFFEGKFGKDHPRWKEEKKATFKKFLRTTNNYVNWRTACFIRDNYKCQDCGKEGGYLEVHHKLPLSKILDDRSILTYEEALKCSELWNIDNGVTYCVVCHSKNDKRRNITNVLR